MESSEKEKADHRSNQTGNDIKYFFIFMLGIFALASTTNIISQLIKSSLTNEPAVQTARVDTLYLSLEDSSVIYPQRATDKLEKEINDLKTLLFNNPYAAIELTKLVNQMENTDKRISDTRNLFYSVIAALLAIIIWLASMTWQLWKKRKE